MKNPSSYRPDITTLMTVELAKCTRRKMKFRSIGLLAIYLAPRLCVHRTTLIRNKNYRSILLRYLVKVGGLESLSTSETDPVAIKTKLALSGLEISNLKRELASLRAQLAAPQNGSGPSDDTRDFADTAMILVEVLRRSQMSFLIDHGTRTIIDLAAKPSERLVAGPQRAGRFIAWIEVNQAIPAIAQLRRT